MFQANLFGHMHVTKAILPYFRAQGNGRIGFTSSSTAWAPLPFMSHYAASKAALSAYVEGLHKEIRSLGIQCVAFECGGFPTHLGQPREEQLKLVDGWKDISYSTDRDSQGYLTNKEMLKFTSILETEV
jgi:short-subunit dehydrogenase